MPSVSFEYFPPKSLEAKNALANTVRTLAEYQPKFQSVTFGAGGSTQSGTLETLGELGAVSDVPLASHLTYTGSSASEVAEFAHELWKRGINRLVALRGDQSPDTSSEVFNSTAQFVQTLRRYHPFEIAVSCYPEVHPLAESLEADIAVLREKELAGASLAISQFFFDNSVFYHFVEKVREAGVTLPIIPGILPIYNFEKVCKMAADCGTSIPGFVKEAFGSSNSTGVDEAEIASELLKAQVHDLAIAGYESIHIYTLNRADLASLTAQSFLETHQQLRNSNQSRVA